jgi:hypothetical protein
MFFLFLITLFVGLFHHILITGTHPLSCSILLVLFFKLVRTMPENLGSWFGPAISTVINPLKEIFFKHVMYCLNTGKNVRAHERAAQTLHGKQIGVQQEIKEGSRSGLTATEEAEHWLKRVDGAISLLYLKRRRLFRIPPPPCSVRHT